MRNPLRALAARLRGQSSWHEGITINPASAEGDWREGPDPQIAHVKLMNEYGCAFPVWGYDAEEDGPYFPEGLVSAELHARLTEWADVFDTHYDSEDGWPSAQMCLQQRAIGADLFAALKRELEPAVTVEFDYWETNVGGSPVREAEPRG